MNKTGTVQPAAATERDLDREWTAVAACAAGLSLSVATLGLYSFGIFVRPLAAEFGWSRTQLSGAISISIYGLAVTSPFWGLLLDRFGPRRIMLPSAVMLSVLVASLSLLTPNLWHLYAVFAAMQIFAGGASPLGYSAVLTRRFNRRLGLALGLGLMGVGLGATILPPLCQALLGEFGWRNAYVILGLITLVVTMPAMLVATRNVRGPASAQRGALVRFVLTLARTRPFVLMSLAFFLMGLVTVGTITQLVPMMIDCGADPAAAARVAALAGLAALAGRGGIGWVLDRVHAPYVFVGVALLGVLAFLLLSYGQNSATAYAAAFLLGAVIGMEVDFISFMVRRYFDPAVFGSLYGIAFGVFNLGAGTGPVVLGSSFDRFGSYSPGLMLFSVIGMVAAFLMLAMPRYDSLQLAD